MKTEKGNKSGNFLFFGRLSVKIKESGFHVTRPIRRTLPTG